MSRMTSRELGAVTLLVTLLLMILSQLPGLIRTNVEVSALDRHPDLRLEALASHFGARYSIPLMIRSVAPGADVHIDGAVALNERVVLPDHLVAIGGARSVTITDASGPVVPSGRYAARTHEVGWTMDLAVSDGSDLEAPIVRILPAERDGPAVVALHLDVLVPSGHPDPPAIGGDGSVVPRPFTGALRDAGIILGLVALGGVFMGRSGTTLGRRFTGAVVALLVGAGLITVATGLLLLAGAPTGRVAVGLTALTLALTHRGVSSTTRRLRDRSTAGAARSFASAFGVGAFGLGAVAVLSAALRHDGVLTLTPDSITLLSQAELLATSFGAVALLAPEILAKRMLSVPAIHALGGPEAGAVVVLGPLVLLAIGVLTAAVAHRIARRRFDAIPAGIVAAIAGSSIVAVERMLANALYVNSHAIVAAAVLGMLLVALDVRLPLAVLGPLAALIALSRAEGALLAALVLLGASLARPRGSEVAIARGPWLWLAGATVLRQTILLRAEVAEGAVTVATLGMLAVGIALATAPLILSRTGQRHRLLLTLVGLLALWATLGAALLIDVGPARPALRATITNVLGAGGWGSVLVLLGVGAAFALIRVAEDEFLPLAVPWIGFVPLGMLLAVLRDGAYRVGTGDSLNRMWIHLLPLLVLLIVLTVAGRARPDGSEDARVEAGRSRAPSADGPDRRIAVMLLGSVGLAGGMIVSLVAAPMAVLTAPVTLPAGLERHQPVGELVAGTSFTHDVRTGLPIALAGVPVGDRSLCVELFAATYGGRDNVGSFAVEVVGSGTRATATVDMGGLRDNEWTLACPDGLVERDLEDLRDGGVIRVSGVDGTVGSSATLWATQDATNGTLEGSSLGLVHRFVTVEQRRRALPPTVLGMLSLSLLLAAGVRSRARPAAQPSADARQP